jgi:hypothetical protein
MVAASGLGYAGVFLAAFLGALSAFLIQWVRLHTDEWASRVDELSDLATEIAELGTEYWTTAYTVDEQPKRLQLEAKIRGRVNLLRSLTVPMRVRLPSADASALVFAIADLADAVTGGDFGDAGRSPEYTRALDCQDRAAAAVVQLRAAHRRSWKVVIATRRLIGWL